MAMTYLYTPILGHSLWGYYAPQECDGALMELVVINSQLVGKDTGT